MPPLFVKEVVEALLNRMKVELELAQATREGALSGEGRVELQLWLQGTRLVN